MKDSSEYVMPIFAFTVNTGGSIERRFVGSGFFADSPNTIISCRHVLEKPKEGQEFYVHHFKTETWHRISDVWLHPKMDIAIGSVEDFGAKIMTPFASPLTLGGDVSVFAYLQDALDGNLAMLPSVAKGHIVNQPPGIVNLISGLGVYTLSFPSLPGFSGAPVGIFNSDYFVGMLFNNKQTDITVFSHEEVQDGGAVWKERVARVQEYGLMLGYGEILTALKMRSGVASDE